MAARKWIRNLSAILMVMVVVVLAVLVVDRARRSIGNRVAGVDPTSLVTEAAQSVYQGFEYMESIDGELVFALNSVRTLGMSSGWHEIEGVRLQFYDEGEAGPVLNCERASFNTQTHDARLAGGIHVEFADGSFLSTEEGRYDNAGRQFTTLSEVVFVGKSSAGNAGSATYYFNADRLELSGGVLVRNDDGGILQSPTISYNRPLNRVVFPEGCRISFAGSRLQAGRAYLELDGEEGQARQFEFTDGVSFSSRDDARAGVIRAWSERIRATRDPGDNWQVEATTTGPWVSIEFLGGRDFIRRTLDTIILRAVIGPGGILNMRAQQRVCISDLPLEGGMRVGESEEAKLWFEEGQPTDVELEREVVLYGDGMEVRGYRARFAAAGDAVLLHANPTGPERVTLRSERGEIQCDQVHLFQADGITEARGNVHGRLQQVQLLGVDRDRPGEQDEPLRFAGGFLEVRQGGTDFELRDNARAWQGHRLLLADQLMYQEDQERLNAIGHVRTTFSARLMNENADPEHDVVVVARSLDYSRTGREAVYRGNVRYSDPTNILSCAELRVVFGDGDEVQEIEALGSVEIEDVRTGQRVSGQEARRQAQSEVITLLGNPAQAMDAEGNVVRGRSLTWDQASGSVTVSGDTETIYVPEETP